LSSWLLLVRRGLRERRAAVLLLLAATL